MVRKLSADELHRIAESNGFVAGAHLEEDEVQQIRDPFTERYLRNQNESLELWKVFMTNKAISTAECLYEGCPAPSNVLVKDFARWYCASRSGRLDKRPNLTTVQNMLKKFFGGFVRVTGTEISDEYRRDIYTWTRNTLVKQAYTTTKKRDKFLFDVDDLVNVVVSAWTKNDSGFFHECMRVQMTFLILVYCFTGARIGAFLHNGKGGAEQGADENEKVVFQGLTWKDVIFYLLPMSDGTTEIVLKIVQRWTKNNKDPENSVEISTYTHKKIRFDVASFLLALAFRDDVFDGITSPAQLWRQRVPEGDTLLELRIKRSKLELPVLRTITRSGGLSDRMLDDSTFRYYFQRIVVNAGYYGTLTIHALRRALANAVDKRATPAERNQILGHSNSDMFGRGYISSISSVDGQAAFLREEARTDHIAKLRSVGTRRAQGLPQKLSSERTMDLLNDSKTRELHRRLCDLRDQDASLEEIETANRQFRIHRKSLKRKALEKWKEDWLDARYQKTIQSGGTVSHDKLTDTHQVQALFRIMPECARLAEMIVSNKLVTRDQHLLAVQDLLSLCQKDFEVVYRPGDEPIDGLCPVCRIKLPKKAHDRPDHIHNCRRNEMMRSIDQQSLPNGSVQVQYCFYCFRWFKDATAWEEHCSKHLLSMNSVWCGIQKYCHTVISPGYCPFCLSDQNISASKRLQAWTRNYLLMEHVDKHIKDMSLSEFICPHPLCDTQMDNLISFQYHLGDTHGLTRLQWKAFGAQQDVDKEASDFMSSTSLDVLSSKTQATRKKRKFNDRTETAFMAWTPFPYAMLPQKPTARRLIAYKLNSVKRRKLVQEGTKLDTTFIAKSCTVSLSTSDSLPGAPMELQNNEGSLCDKLSDFCPELSQNDSCLTFSSEEDQIMGALAPITRRGHDEISTKPVTDPILYVPVVPDVVSEMSSIPVDPVLLSLNESSASNAFPQTFEETNTGERIHAPLFTEVNTSSDKNSLANPIVVTDQPRTPTAEGRRAAQANDQLRESRAKPILERDSECQPALQVSDDRDTSEETLSILRFAHEGSKRNSAQDTSNASSNDLFSKCPICQRDVSSRGRSKSKPMNFHQQMAFCKDHQVKDAETEWAHRGYPRIAWRRLHLRLMKKSSALRDIINESSSSFFRTILQAAVDRKEPCKYRCMENMTSGYYGPRGQQIMSEYIILEFGSNLRRKAIVDPFLRVVGVSDYVNTVLVPELAVMLIKEDMKVDEEVARDILKQSVGLGELLNEEMNL